MKIIYKKGDLFKGPEKHFIHGCNAHGVFGSGFAKIVRDGYPEIYEVYRKEHLTNGLEGGTFTYNGSKGKVGINLITQENYGRDNNRYVKYDWVANGFQNVDVWALENKITEIAMPLIGAGLGGGNWKIIETIIEEYSTNFQPIVYVI